jgi:large subunit ribosomal protein L5
MNTVKDKQKTAFEAMKKTYGFTNVMQAPRIMKVVVSAGVGKFKDDSKKVALVGDRLAKITGQKSSARAAKRSIASFKSREGEIIGYQITLRGDKMWNFVDKLVHIALPRTKDFRGLERSSVDAMGNYTIGIKENTIFPEVSEEELKDVFGFAISIITNVKDPKQTVEFLEQLGFPMKRA